MKKSLFLSAFVAFSYASFAQPVINSTDYDLSGTPSFSYKYGTVTTDPGPAGANVNWDFSSLNLTTVYNVTINTCPGGDCASFPNATHYLGTGFTDVFYNKTSSVFEEVGESSSSSSIATFNDPYTFLQFPVIFGQTYNDNYFISNNTGTTKDGTLHSTIDAYGTLKTPAGTYSNVLRQKLVDIYEVDADGTNIKTIMTQYYWYKAGFPFSLMSTIDFALQLNNETPTLLNSVTTYNTTAGSGTKIETNNLLNSLFSLYPNPTTAQTFVSAIKCTVNQITMTDILGKVVMNQEFTDKANAHQFVFPINTSQLTKGVYLINISTKEGTVTKKLTVK